MLKGTTYALSIYFGAVRVNVHDNTEKPVFSFCRRVCFSCQTLPYANPAELTFSFNSLVYLLRNEQSVHTFYCRSLYVRWHYHSSYTSTRHLSEW